MRPAVSFWNSGSGSGGHGISFPAPKNSSESDVKESRASTTLSASQPAGDGNRPGHPGRLPAPGPGKEVTLPPPRPLRTARGIQESRHPRTRRNPGIQKESRHPRTRRNPGESRHPRSSAPARSFSVGYLTWQDDLVLLSITVVVDTISAVNARRCFRTLADAYVLPPPDRR
jgi:hypothetical protein